jgi:hypothetical protein
MIAKGKVKQEDIDKLCIKKPRMDWDRINNTIMKLNMYIDLMHYLGFLQISKRSD